MKTNLPLSYYAPAAERVLIEFGSTLCDERFFYCHTGSGGYIGGHTGLATIRGKEVTITVSQL